MRNKVLFGVSIAMIALFAILISNSFSQTTPNQKVSSDEDLYNAYVEDFISLSSDQPDDLDILSPGPPMGPPPFMRGEEMPPPHHGPNNGEMAHENFMGPPPCHNDDFSDDMFFLDP